MIMNALIVILERTVFFRGSNNVGLATVPAAENTGPFNLVAIDARNRTSIWEFSTK